MGLYDKYYELQNEIKKQAAVLVNNSFKSFFERFPDVKALRFAAYTPYFNDGDPCLYSVHSFDVFLSKEFKVKNSVSSYFDKNLDPEDGIVDDDFEGDYGESVWFLRYNYKDNVVVQQMCDLIKDMEDMPAEVAESIFGDDALVTVTKEGIDISHFRHD